MRFRIWPLNLCQTLFQFLLAKTWNVLQTPHLQQQIPPPCRLCSNLQRGSKYVHWGYVGSLKITVLPNGNVNLLLRQTAVKSQEIFSKEQCGSNMHEGSSPLGCLRMLHVYSLQ